MVSFSYGSIYGVIILRRTIVFTTKIDYDRQYSELYIATQKAKGKIPQETYDKFSSALKSYNNASIFQGKRYPVYYLSDVKDM